MNEEQFKAAVRQAFSLVDTADRAILDVDQLLGRVMLQVRRLVETLPEEGLLRNQSWSAMRSLVQSELEIYTKALERAIQREQVIASPGMADYAAREARYAGANLTNGLGAPEPASVVAMVDKTVMGKSRPNSRADKKKARMGRSATPPIPPTSRIPMRSIVIPTGSNPMVQGPLDQPMGCRKRKQSGC